MTVFIELDPAYSTTRRVRKADRRVVQAELIAEKDPKEKFETVLFQPECDGGRAEGGLRTRGYFKKNNDEMPLITVITVVFNCETHIEDTILSVINQTYDNIEYILIDGGSTDRTLDIIRKHEHAIDYWLSEPDSGIYNAMNKGIALAMGEVISLVNADDVVYPNTLESIMEVLSTRPEVGYTMAPVELAYEDGRVFGLTRPLAENELVDRMWQEMPCPHQGISVRREIYKTLDVFDENYLLSADYEYLLRLLVKGIPYVRLEQPVGFFRVGGMSGGLRTWIETRRLLYGYGRPALEIEFGFVVSLAKMMVARYLPNNLFKKLKKFNVKSKRNLY